MQPFEVDVSTLGATLRTLIQFVGAVLSRQSGIIAQVHDQPGVLMLSVWIVLLAGLSEGIGQSVVLFVNEVTPRRFVISLFLTALLFGGGYLLWVGTIWALATLLFRPGVAIGDVVRGVGLGYAPLLFGFLGLIPYFGAGINNLLYFWSFTAVVAAVGVTLSLSLVEATIVSVAGGVLILVLRATYGKPVVKFFRRIRNAAAGRRLILKVQQAVASRSLDVFDIPPGEDEP
jgi:hypothetical protein